MYPIQISVILHLVGVGLLFAALFGGFVLTAQYRRAKEWSEKLLLLRAMRAVGLLSPFGVLVVLLTGIGNMTLGPHQYTPFSDSWLSVKLTLFLVNVILGVGLSIVAARRGKLAAELAAGPASGEGTARLKSLDSMLLLSSFLQAVLMLVILGLSIVRP